MDRPHHALQALGPVGAVFRVTDGASRCVGIGMHQIDLALPAGIYTVSATLGRSVETREVLLDAPQRIELHATMPTFGDRAFSLAPAVMAALGSHDFRPGGQFIALRGPWRDEDTAEALVTLERGGTSLYAAREGFLPDPQGLGVWSWQLFDLAPEEGQDDAPATVSATRAVCDAAQPLDALPGEELADAEPASTHSTSPEISHVLPCWGNWVIWGAYPSMACVAPEGADLPLSYYVRLRLTKPGATPAPNLQSLSDQVFTALAARSVLPLSAPVLDLLFAPEQTDPLLVLATAHLVSITLERLGKKPPELPRLPQDASQAEANRTTEELGLFDTATWQQRFGAWLGAQHDEPLASSPDMVALRFLFGIDTHAHVRTPPVLLRSLDGLFAAMQSHDTASAGISFDDGMWGSHMQVSDSFAFLQWAPHADYQRLLRQSMARSLKSIQSMLDTAQFIQNARIQIEQEKSGIAQRFRGMQGNVAKPSSALAVSVAAIPLDLESFIKDSASSLRIPASAISQFSSALNSLPIDKSGIDDMLQQWSGRLTKD